MQIIDHQIDAIAATSEDSAWPVTNTEDDLALNYWKAVDNVQTATITLTMPDLTPYCNAVYIGYTSANLVTLQVWNAAETTQLVADTNMYLIPFNFFTFLQQRQVVQTRETFENFTNPDEQAVIKLAMTTTEITDLVITNGGSGYSAGTLTATGGNGANFRGTYTVNSSGAIDSVTIINPGIGYTNFSSATPTIVVSDTSGTGAVITPKSTINAGIIRAGYAKEFKNPKFGFTEQTKNYGYRIEYLDGTLESINGRIRRNFRVNMNIGIDEEENLKEMLDKAVREPCAFNMFNNVTWNGSERRGIIFGWLDNDPTYIRNSLDRIDCSFNIREV